MLLRHTLTSSHTIFMLYISPPFSSFLFHFHVFHPLLTSSPSQVQTVRQCSLQLEALPWALLVETLLCCWVISPREPPTGSSPFWSPCVLRVERAPCRTGVIRAMKLATHVLTPQHQTVEITWNTQRASSPCDLSAWLLFAQLPAQLSGTRLCHPCWLPTTCWGAFHLFT